MYVIAHRCNDREDIGVAINKGVNAIECDLQYAKTSTQIFVNHDSASGNNLSEWLNSAKSIMAIHPRQFALIIFDCKFAAKCSDGVTGEVLIAARQRVRQYLHAGERKPINVLFSIAKYGDRNGFAKFIGDLLPNEGVAIDQSDDPAAVQEYFDVKGVANCWYGYGIWTGGTKDVYRYIKKGCELRDRDGVLKKIYVWTLAEKSSIQKYIDNGLVDGVMINVPGTGTRDAPGLEEALTTVNDSKVARMATRDDDAFAVYRLPA